MQGFIKKYLHDPKLSEVPSVKQAAMCATIYNLTQEPCKHNKNEDSESSDFIHTPLHRTSTVILGMALGKEILYPKLHDLESNQSQVCRLLASKDLILN